MNKPKLYLIPCLLGNEAQVNASLPPYNLNIIKSLNHFAVEHIKDTRRFFVKCGLKHKVNSSSFKEINKRSEIEDVLQVGAWMKKGNSVGVISDAGCPGIADPGAKVVEWAHSYNFEVIPLIGPSSILLALMASGMNGQSFAFHGYLDRDSKERKSQISILEQEAITKKNTQIFMETPYRNEPLWSDLIDQLRPSTRLCIAMDISLPSALIQTKTVENWKKEKLSLHKRPAIFLISI